MQVLDSVIITKKFAGDLADLAGPGRDSIAVVALGAGPGCVSLNGEGPHLGIIGLLDESL